MATNLPNRASVTYSYGTTTDTAVSNETNTTLLDEYTMTLTKNALAATVTAGDNEGYTILIENDGSGVLYNPTVTDNLGANVGSNLTYVTGSAQFFVNGTPITGTVTGTGSTVTFTAQTTLDAGDNLLIVYLAKTSGTASGQIVNTARGSANSGSATGLAVTDTDTATVNLASVANLSVFKAADKTTVNSGDTLTYTFTIMNSGAQTAEDISFVDTLPPEFTVTGVSYTVNGVTTPISASDYVISAGNTLTIPAAGSTLVIDVPGAATGGGSGEVVITVTGTVAYTTPTAANCIR